MATMQQSFHSIEKLIPRSTGLEEQKTYIWSIFSLVFNIQISSEDFKETFNPIKGKNRFVFHCVGDGLAAFLDAKTEVIKVRI